MNEQTLATPIPGATASPEVTVESQADWFLTDGVPGTGPRPDFLEAKYKSVSDQAKAYKDAQKLIGTLPSAPEEYEFGDLQEAIDRDNSHIKDFINYAKENRFQQDTFQKVLKTFVEYDRSRQPNVDQEIAKLGPDGASKVTTVQQWVKNNLSPDAQKALEKLPVRAEVVKMLDEIRQMHTHNLSRIPADADKQANFKVLTVAEVEAEMLANYKRYQEDPVYRDKISQKFEQAVGG